MDLTTHINQLNIAQQLDQTNELIQKAESRITFWGSRKITVAGYKGAFFINELAIKVHVAAAERCNAGDLTTKERIAGLDLYHRINELHEQTEQQLKKKNLITRLFVVIREIIPPFVTRFSSELTGQYFSSYSQKSSSRHLAILQKKRLLIAVG